MRQVYVVYSTDAWHSFSSRECKGIFTSKRSAVNAIVRNFDIDLDEISYMDCKGERCYLYDRKLDEEIIRIYQNRVIDPKNGENYDLASDFRNAVIMAFEQTSGYKILEVFDEC